MVCQAWTQIALIFALARLHLVIAGHAVTGITKVSGAPAEEQGNGATISALPVNELRAVLFALFNSSADNVRGAFPANEVLKLEVSSLLLRSIAVFQAPEVGLFALEAHIVGALEHGVVTKSVVVLVPRIFELFVFVQTFDFGSFNSLFLDFVFNFGKFEDLILNRSVVFTLHWHFAGWAV